MANKVLFNVLQWNAQSIRPKLLSFSEMLIQEKIHIAALSETWLEPDSNFNISGYNVYRSDRDDSYGGVAIFLHNSIKAQQKPVRLNNADIEIICVQLFNCKPFEYVIAVYCPSRIVTNRHDWDSLFSMWSHNAIILGDFNAHHTTWSYKNDHRGNLIYDALMDSNFFVLNDGTHTRVRLVDNNWQQSAPDLSLISNDIALGVNWNVLNENLGSDHLIIKILSQLSLHIPPISKKKFRNVIG